MKKKINNLVMAKHYNMSRVVGQRKTEFNRRKKRRRAKIERRRLQILTQEKQSDSKSNRILVYVR